MITTSTHLERLILTIILLVAFVAGITWLAPQIATNLTAVLTQSVKTGKPAL